MKISFSLYSSSSSCLAPKVATNHYLLVRFEAQGYTNEVNNWFSLAIGRTCCLLRYSMSNDYLLLNKCKNGGMRRDMQSRVTFANEAQFLLISEESVSDLNNRISSSMSLYCFHLWISYWNLLISSSVWKCYFLFRLHIWYSKYIWRRVIILGPSLSNIMLVV